MRQSGNPAARNDIFQRRRVAKMRLEQLGAYLVSDFRDVRVRLELGNFEHQLARERIAIGVQPGRRQGD